MRILFFLICSTLASCYPHATAWHSIFIPSHNRFHDVFALIHDPLHEVSGIKIEIIRYREKVYGYISVNYFSLPFNAEDENTTTLSIQTDSTKKTFVLPLLAGKERSPLTKDCLKYLLETFQSSSSTVILSSGPFVEKINPSQFISSYNAFLRKPTLITPPQLKMDCTLF